MLEKVLKIKEPSIKGRRFKQRFGPGFCSLRYNFI